MTRWEWMRGLKATEMASLLAETTIMIASLFSEVGANEIRAVCDTEGLTDKILNWLEEAADAPDEIPAADVAPVVYCKDCVYLGFKDCYGVCEGGPMCGIVRPWDFCSHGVRKEKDE